MRLILKTENYRIKAAKKTHSDKAAHDVSPKGNKSFFFLSQSNAPVLQITFKPSANQLTLLRSEQILFKSEQRSCSVRCEQRLRTICSLYKERWRIESFGGEYIFCRSLEV